MIAIVLAAAVPVADPTPAPSPSVRYIDPEAVTPGVLGLVIFLVLAVATVVLWLSMNKQLKKIDFDEDAVDAGDGDEVVRLPSDSQGSSRDRS